MFRWFDDYNPCESGGKEKKIAGFVPCFDSEETLVVTLNNSAPNDVQLLSIVKDSLFYEEIRGKDMGMNNAWEQDLVTKNRGRSKSRRFDSHRKLDDRSKTSDTSQLRGCRECFNYRKIGHIKMGFEKLNRKGLKSIEW